LYFGDPGGLIVRILVIGETHFIGPAIVRRLHRAGHDVTLFHRGQTESDDLLDVRHIHGDRERLADYARDFEALAPEVVLDMRAMSEADVRAVKGAFRGIAQRVVTVSSMDVYRAYGRVNRIEPGPPDPVPLTEDAPLREQLYPYRGKVEGFHDYEKILVERAAMEEPALPGTVLRLPMAHGPGDYQHRLFPYLKRMDDGRPAIVLDGGLARMRATRGYVEDIAIAIAHAVIDERAAGRIYNVGEADPLPEAEWVRAIGRAAGWSGEVVVVPRDRLPEQLQWDGDSDQDFVADTTRIRAELGYAEGASRDEALRRTVAWERANPPTDVLSDMFDYAAEDEALARVG